MAKPTKPDGAELVLQNRRASFNYELGDRYEAGLVLMGSEVKTLRAGSGDLTDGWVTMNRGELYLMGMYLPRLLHAAFGHEERRPRKLLLKSSEIDRIRKALDHDKATIVPTLLYWKKGRAKIEIAVAKGKKMADKRHTIKERDLEREARTAMRRGKNDE
jgi:SsrA-binding protein